MIESMTNAGIALGLDKQIAEKLSIQTALGASTMSKQSTDSANVFCLSLTASLATIPVAPLPTSAGVFGIVRTIDIRIFSCFLLYC
jgi:hypothetical protein